MKKNQKNDGYIEELKKLRENNNYDKESIKDILAKIKSAEKRIYMIKYIEIQESLIERNKIKNWNAFLKCILFSLNGKVCFGCWLFERIGDFRHVGKLKRFRGYGVSSKVYLCKICKWNFGLYNEESGKNSMRWYMEKIDKPVYKKWIREDMWNIKSIWEAFEKNNIDYGERIKRQLKEDKKKMEYI